MVNGFVLGARAYGAHLTFRRQRISRANDPWWFRHFEYRAIASLLERKMSIAWLPTSEGRMVKSKPELRKRLHAARRQHVASLNPSTSALLFRIPPAPLLKMVPADAVIGLYHAVGDEAPTTAYAQHFLESGHRIALPRFKSGDDLMHFAQWQDPFGKSDLTLGTFGLMEPTADAQEIEPRVLLVPLLGFTKLGERIGRGGGHYDRWLSKHPKTVAIGMAWDAQLCDELPVEPHDKPLNAIITPTRFYGPFDAR